MQRILAPLYLAVSLHAADILLVALLIIWAFAEWYGRDNNRIVGSGIQKGFVPLRGWEGPDEPRKWMIYRFISSRLKSYRRQLIAIRIIAGLALGLWLVRLALRKLFPAKLEAVVARLGAAMHPFGPRLEGVQQLLTHLGLAISDHLIFFLLGSLVIFWILAELYRPQHKRKQERLMSSLSSGGHKTIVEFMRAHGQIAVYKKRLVALRIGVGILVGLDFLYSAFRVLFQY